MVSQNIGNLVSPADHELFSKLLPSLFRKWADFSNPVFCFSSFIANFDLSELHSTGRDDSQSLMDPTVEYHNERRSHTFLCQFRVSSPSGSNVKLMFIECLLTA